MHVAALLEKYVPNSALNHGYFIGKFLPFVGFTGDVG
jgi:hypothetical protein